VAEDSESEFQAEELAKLDFGSSVPNTNGRIGPVWNHFQRQGTGCGRLVDSWDENGRGRGPRSRGGRRSGLEGRRSRRFGASILPHAPEDVRRCTGCLGQRTRRTRSPRRQLSRPPQHSYEALVLGSACIHRRAAEEFATGCHSVELRGVRRRPHCDRRKRRGAKRKNRRDQAAVRGTLWS